MSSQEREGVFQQIMFRLACWIDADIWITGSQSSIHTGVEDGTGEGERECHSPRRA